MDTQADQLEKEGNSARPPPRELERIVAPLASDAGIKLIEIYDGYAR